ncbi:uncharacterized protein LOC109503591 [Harpegnathos saltator]|uniref:uncharacterized protein LOC109503591 n=1 Tax=Harpegnathos saltator TaxID=610380 RepID=UPI0009488F63|nr:uncharacterized protein LOC109503591 [Harpegnathos saltator]
MAGIFKSGIARRSDCLVAFMVVGPTHLCQKISNSLHQSAKEKKWDISVHQCESISDVIKAKIDISVDYIIFAFDSRVSHTLSEVEANITVIDEYYIISGVTCLVNSNGISNIGLVHKAKELCHKYNIRFLSAKIFDVKACTNLGDRILNITENLLGLSSGIPVIGRMMHN